VQDAWKNNTGKQEHSLREACVPVRGQDSSKDVAYGRMEEDTNSWTYSWTLSSRSLTKTRFHLPFLATKAPTPQTMAAANAPTPIWADGAALSTDHPSLVWINIDMPVVVAMAQVQPHESVLILSCSTNGLAI